MQVEAQEHDNPIIIPDACNNSSSTTTKWQRIFRILIYVPYFVGILWTCLHPIVSVITGELKCRGWYLDEHSIEIRFAEITTYAVPSHLQGAMPRTPMRLPNLCDGIQATKEASNTHNFDNLFCYGQRADFQIATIVPIANSVDPIEEAIVFVVPPPPKGDWTTSTFHATLLRSLHHLADPMQTPWLAKTLILVAPTIDKATHHNDTGSLLETTVSNFLDAYLGAEHISHHPPVPPRLCQALLRTLIVLDVEDHSSTTTTAHLARNGGALGHAQIAVLPQGRRGVLPNLDLVFLIGKLFTKAMYLQPQRYPQSTFLAHDHAQESAQVATWLLQHNQSISDIKVRDWMQNLADMALFASTMAKGPYPPHTPALDQGIDALTIKATFQGSFLKDPAVETVQYWNS